MRSIMMKLLRMIKKNGDGFCVRTYSRLDIFSCVFVQQNSETCLMFKYIQKKKPEADGRTLICNHGD